MNGLQRLPGVLVLLGLLALPVPAHARDATTPPASSGDLVAAAMAADDLQTLVRAVQAAELVDVLQSPGPFTVFAPTDAAFADLPAAKREQLLQDPDRLKAVLLHHVVSGRLYADEVVQRTDAQTALGQALRFEVSDQVRVNGAAIIQADIAADNGIIHVIDRVLLPERDIVEVAREAGNFRSLLMALEVTGMTQTLRESGPFTVFAPTDGAFEQLPRGVVDALLQDTDRLSAVLSYHVVAGQIPAAELAQRRELKTVGGQPVEIDGAAEITVAGAALGRTDIPATNGIIHVIDTVLLPPGMAIDNPGDPIERSIALAIELGAPLFNDGSPEACLAVYEVTAATLLELGGGQLAGPARKRLEDGLNAARRADNARSGAWALRRAFDDVLAMRRDATTMRPLRDADDQRGNARGGGDRAATVTLTEGAFRWGSCRVTTPLPKGYPAPTPPGAIEVKRYPQVRRAEFTGTVAPDAGMNLAFFPLFNHIKRRGIAMTAPVEMDYAGFEAGDPEAGDQEAAGAWTMSFLYRTPDQGPAGIDAADERVRVVDTTPVTVLALGVRGAHRRDDVARGLAQLQDWLAQQSQWEIAGDPRALFYNGPQVPVEDQWSEVQLPIRRL